MRIVVISDTHRRADIAEKVISRQETAAHIFFLGDVTSDIEDMQYIFPEKKFHIVSGNCDYFSLYPTVGIEKIDGHSILYTHGHTFGVKSGTERLIKAARDSGCDIALYGHTHISKILYENGVYVVNPGSLSQPREGHASYAVIDIEKNGVMPFTVEV